MRVGELRKALEGVPDDVPVVAIPKGGQALTDRIPTNHAFCVGDRTDSYVGAFAIEFEDRTDLNETIQRAQAAWRLRNNNGVLD